MNRELKRKAMKNMKKEARVQAKQKFTMLDLQRAMGVALEMKAQSGGHLFSSNIKNRCIFCGEDQKTKKDCPHSFMTFLDRMQTVLINPGFFRDDEIQAQWFQHGDEYDGIRLALLDD